MVGLAVDDHQAKGGAAMSYHEMYEWGVIGFGCFAFGFALGYVLGMIRRR